MKIRCDKPMRRSKEQAYIGNELWVKRWECTGDCKGCICAIVMDSDGTEHHVKLRGGDKFAKIHDTIDTSNKEKQQSNHNQ